MRLDRLTWIGVAMIVVLSASCGNSEGDTQVGAQAAYRERAAARAVTPDGTSVLGVSEEQLVDLAEAPGAQQPAEAMVAPVAAAPARLERRTTATRSIVASSSALSALRIAIASSLVSLGAQQVTRAALSNKRARTLPAVPASVRRRMEDRSRFAPTRSARAATAT